MEQCAGEMQEKLANWKSQYLSLGGRATLINGALDALPTYMMSVYPMPASVRNEFNAIRRNFLWQGNCDPKKHKFHLVKWNKVLVRKKEGD